MGVRSLGQEDPLEEGIAPYSSILALEILWTEEPGGLQSIRSQRVGHDLMTKQQQHTFFGQISSVNCWFIYCAHFFLGLSTLFLYMFWIHDFCLIFVFSL